MTKQKSATDIILKELLNREIKDPKIFSLAIYFYYNLLKDLNTKIEKEAEYKIKLINLIKNKLYPYYKLYLNPKLDKRDLNIEKILENII